MSIEEILLSYHENIDNFITAGIGNPEDYRDNATNLINQEITKARQEGKKEVIDNIKKWVQGRLTNYGRDETINRLQERLTSLNNQLKDKE